MNGPHTTPSFAVPRGACDCHMHIFGPLDRYPPAPTRSYTPREASLADYERMAATLGLDRFVFVQASPYGADNSCLIDTLRIVGNRARGVAVIDATTSDDDLAELDSVGVRGVRVNAATFGVSSATEIERMLNETVARVAPFGWHVQLFASLATIADLAPVLSRLRVPVILDHMGLAKGQLGIDQPGFATLLGLVADGVWVKVSGAYRVSTEGPAYADAAPIARALIAAAPDRVVWGTDWPHTGRHANSRLDGPPLIDYLPLDDGALMSLLAEWGDAAVIKKILVDNPARFYRFDETDTA